MGTFVGLVVWDKQPADKVAVKLCETFDYQGCHGTTYSGTTNKDGYYVFSNIKPGAYVVVFNISSEFVIYLTDGTNPIKDFVSAGRVSIAETRYIFKDNLDVTAPAMNAKVNAQPTLKWKAYPGAAYYKVTIASLRSDFSIGPVKVETNEYTVDKPLAECSYMWGVEAYNDEDRKIGETPNTTFATNTSLIFDAVNSDSSCHLKLLSQKNNAEVQGDQGVEFSWEPNPQATCYRIILLDDQGNYQNPFIINGTQITYKVNSVPKGVYTWAVKACNASNQTIATSDYITLIVR